MILKSYNLLCIILVMILVPFSVYNYASLFIVFFSLISILGIIFKIQGQEFVLIAISLCLPSGWQGNTGISFLEIDRLFDSYRHVLLVIPILSFVLCQNSDIKRKMILTMIIIMSVGLISLLNTGNIIELIRAWIILSTSYCFMVICYRDNKIYLEDIFLYIDLLFLITVGYAFLDFFLGISPYHSFYNSITDFSKIIQAKGLLGNALHLTGVAMFYQSVIFIRLLLTRKIYYYQEILCIFLTLISLSRTAIIVLLLEYILFIFLSKTYKNIKVMFFNVIGILIVLGVIMLYVDELVFSLISRFEEGSIAHRQGAYLTVFRLFIDNLFGVGYYNIMDSISREGFEAEGFASRFSTLDNLFLTQIAAYGMFGFIMIYYYYRYFILLFLRRKKNRLLFKVILLLFFPYILQSFTYDWENSYCLCLLLYGFIGFILKEFSKNERKSISYNCYL